VDKITVVCHKDHDRGYEDFQGKCLLCVVDDLMLEMGNLMIQKQRLENREWVGLTDEEKEKLVEAFYGTDIQRLEAIEAKLKEKNT
jgi:hypothetical protein